VPGRINRRVGSDGHVLEQVSPHTVEQCLRRDSVPIDQRQWHCGVGRGWGELPVPGVFQDGDDYDDDGGLEEQEDSLESAGVPQGHGS
jgi:hypothetical protein